MKYFDTPILFLVFNRPQLTSKVFEQIKKVKPKFLYVASDGARGNHPSDVEKCNEVKSIILNGIDWDCELKTLFRDQNLGCGRALSQAITWFFKNVEEGIIIEDDSFPSLSFFSFCEKSLLQFRHDERIYNIGGSNFQCGIARSESSFFFSKYSHIWGWATWRRAWEKYQFDISGENIDQVFGTYSFSSKEKKYWTLIFKKTANHEFDTWDYSWLFSIWKNKGLSIVSTKNLVRNIGIGADSTHTSVFSEAYDLCLLEEMTSYTAPPGVFIDGKADRFYGRHFLYPKTSLRNVIRNISYKVIPSTLYTNLKKLKTLLKFF